MIFYIYYGDIYFEFADIDECIEGLDDCDLHAECKNSIGSYDCACVIGFSGDGLSCGMLKDYIMTQVQLWCKFVTDCSDGAVLLYDGTTFSTNHSNGTVLVCLDNEYGTVCDDWWDPLDATVVCTQLGFSANGEH